jgi:site-specific recombinase XerD
MSPLGAQVFRPEFANPRQRLFKVENAAISAGIDGASSHSGRRTFATSLSSRGASIRVLMKILGHRNISTTIGYVDASDDMLRRAVELV